MNPDEQNKAKNKLERHFFYSSAEFMTTETSTNAFKVSVVLGTNR